MFSHVFLSDCNHLLAHYNILTVKFRKAWHTILVVNMVQMHYPVNLISFLAVKTTYGITALHHIAMSDGCFMSYLFQ